MGKNLSNQEEYKLKIFEKNLTTRINPKYDSIYIYNGNILDMEFSNYIDFSEFITQKYIEDSTFSGRYDSIRRFKSIYFRLNYVLNNHLLKDLNSNSKFFIEKFNLLFGLKISPYEELKEEHIEIINKKVQSVIDKNKNLLSTYELPVFIFFGEYFRNKYNANWFYKKATNDLDHNFIIPEFKVEGKDFELNRKIFRYLYHPNLTQDWEKFDLRTIINFDCLIRKKLFKNKLKF